MSASRNTATQGPPPTEPPVSTQPSPSPQPSPTTSQQASPSPPPPTSRPSSPSPPPQTSSQQQSPAPTSQAPATTDGPNGSPSPRPDATTTSRGAVVEPSPIVFTSNGSTFTSKVPVPTVSGLTSTVSSSIGDNVSNGSSSGSSTGVIIGVVVGIVGMLLIGGGVLWWRRINKPKSRRYNLDDIFTSPSANAQAPEWEKGLTLFSDRRTPAAPSSDVNRHEATSEYSAVPVRSSTDFSQSHLSHHQPQQQAPQFLMADGSNPYMNAQSQQQQQHAQAYYDAATLAYYQQQQAAYYQQYGQYPPADASYDPAQLQHQQQQYAAATQPSSNEKSSHMFNVYDNANRLSAHSDFASPPAFIEKERADANQWTTDEAVAWVTEKEYGDASTVALMKEQEIDGRSLLLLSNHDLEHTLKISDAKRRDRFEDAIS
ncbi:hypothetical protein BJ741DRAFT_601245, partial [Chytriomyces cf. hyalinus JEL632]